MNYPQSIESISSFVNIVTKLIIVSNQLHCIFRCVNSFEKFRKYWHRYFGSPWITYCTFVFSTKIWKYDQNIYFSISATCAKCLLKNEYIIKIYKKNIQYIFMWKKFMWCFLYDLLNLPLMNILVFPVIFLRLLIAISRLRIFNLVYETKNLNHFVALFQKVSGHLGATLRPPSLKLICNYCQADITFFATSECQKFAFI